MIKQNEIAKHFGVAPYFITMIKKGDRSITYKMGEELNRHDPSYSVGEWRNVSWVKFKNTIDEIINPTAGKHQLSQIGE